jgi:hypothetical protein
MRWPEADDSPRLPEPSPWPTFEGSSGRESSRVRYADNDIALVSRSSLNERRAGEPSPAMPRAGDEGPKGPDPMVSPWPDLPAAPDPAGRGDDPAAAARLARLIADQEERGWSGSRS